MYVCLLGCIIFLLTCFMMNSKSCVLLSFINSHYLCLLLLTGLYFWKKFLTFLQKAFVVHLLVFLPIITSFFFVPLLYTFSYSWFPFIWDFMLPITSFIDIKFIFLSSQIYLIMSSDKLSLPDTISNFVFFIASFLLLPVLVRVNLSFRPLFLLHLYQVELFLRITLSVVSKQFLCICYHLSFFIFYIQCSTEYFLNFSIIFFHIFYKSCPWFYHGLFNCKFYLISFFLIYFKSLFFVIRNLVNFSLFLTFVFLYSTFLSFHGFYFSVQNRNLNVLIKSRNRVVKNIWKILGPCRSSKTVWLFRLR